MQILLWPVYKKKRHTYMVGKFSRLTFSKEPFLAKRSPTHWNVI